MLNSAVGWKDNMIGRDLASFYVFNKSPRPRITVRLHLNEFLPNRVN
jgi:hypothetical protein